MLFSKIKPIFRERNAIFLEIITTSQYITWTTEADPGFLDIEFKFTKGGLIGWFLPGYLRFFPDFFFENSPWKWNHFSQGGGGGGGWGSIEHHEPPLDPPLDHIKFYGKFTWSEKSKRARSSYPVGLPKYLYMEILLLSMQLLITIVYVEVHFNCFVRKAERADRWTQCSTMT